MWYITRNLVWVNFGRRFNKSNKPQEDESILKKVRWLWQTKRSMGNNSWEHEQSIVPGEISQSQS